MTATEKSRLRRELQARRLAVPPEQHSIAAQGVARHFSDHPILAFAKTFAGYAAMRGEIDVFPIFPLMLRFKGKQGFLPRMNAETRRLDFCPWAPGEPLALGTHAVREPQSPVGEIPEILLVPCLAFTNDGARLGYGGGWYDRTLEYLRAQPNHPQVFGVAYSWQEMPHLPTESHDAPLDGILTELGVSMFQSPSRQP
jgi:5-formyltetrahydrofolate cyclo-ligase